MVVLKIVFHNSHPESARTLANLTAWIFFEKEIKKLHKWMIKEEHQIIVCDTFFY